ncbi:pyocin S6 family toxin immunity protein [Pseudomonas frederiksbergensis]|uniref:pyocin S6 family toxin immunity protein n=1 Tax=Pseudomonas frederiksbergensis TaxID=104087 RepID=UPI00218223CA|nr:pyocin S6 family toxin immunity protein [Pseudomonas frederiksbergensis]
MNIFIALSGFFSEPNTDDSLQYEKDVPQALEGAVLKAMGWSALWDIPEGEHELSHTQAVAIMEIVGSSFRNDLVYYLGLCQRLTALKKS